MGAEEQGNLSIGSARTTVDAPKTFSFALFDGLDWQPPGPHSPEVGDAIKYRDGTVAVVGTSSLVSYGPRSEMVAVAQLIKREEAKATKDPAPEATAPAAQVLASGKAAEGEEAQATEEPEAK
jgi:hypothetical protein